MLTKELESPTIDNLLAIIKEANTSFSSPPWYRGIGAESYKLLPSLYRSSKDIHELISIQKKLVAEFDRKSVLMEQGSKHDLQISDKLTQMQHYGIPTTMMDWTVSPLIALYFALITSIKDEKDENALLYCLDAEKWNNDIRPNAANPIRDLGELDQLGLNPFNMNRTQPLAFFPKLINPRINRQLGTFVVFGDGKVPMEETEYNANLLKIVILKDHVSDLYKELSLLGVSAISVYPDLTGLSFDLKQQYGI